MPKMTDKDISFKRREFLTTSIVGSVTLFSHTHVGQAAPQGGTDFLTEYGFWDYTTPGAGGMEAFKENDYLSLLDDMAAANMNSLMIYVKWLTTGYRSRLSFQDQMSDKPCHSLRQHLTAESHRRSWKEKD